MSPTTTEPTEWLDRIAGGWLRGYCECGWETVPAWVAWIARMDLRNHSATEHARMASV